MLHPAQICPPGFGIWTWGVWSVSRGGPITYERCSAGVGTPPRPTPGSAWYASTEEEVRDVALEGAWELPKGRSLQSFV